MHKDYTAAKNIIAAAHHHVQSVCDVIASICLGGCIGTFLKTNHFCLQRCFFKNGLVAASSLNIIKGKNLINSLRAQLNKCHFKDRVPLYAGIDGEYDAIAQTFCLHFHVITPFSGRLYLKQLKQEFFKVEKHHHLFHAPMQIKEVLAHDKLSRKKVMTYVMKGYWPMKGMGRRIRPPEPFHSLYLLWRDKQGFTDLRLLYGLEIKNNKLVSKISTVKN